MEARQSALIEACESEDALALAALITSSAVDQASLMVKDEKVNNLKLYSEPYYMFFQ